jgi:hypothetical protein
MWASTSRSPRKRVQFHLWISQALPATSAAHAHQAEGPPYNPSGWALWMAAGDSEGAFPVRQSPRTRGSYRRCVQILWPSRKEKALQRGYPTIKLRLSGGSKSGPSCGCGRSSSSGACAGVLLTHLRRQPGWLPRRWCSQLPRPLATGPAAYGTASCRLLPHQKLQDRRAV